jgi:23S rRNA pseudouridine2605 synthase
VGRLDVNTTGALLITNDGLLCYRLTHPKFEVPRTYVARVRGQVTAKGLARMRRMAHGATRGKAKGSRDGGDRGGVEVVKELGKVTVLKVSLREGRNRQVRRLCEAAGLRVVKLKRVSFGPLSVRKLPLGAVRPLERREIERLERITLPGSGEDGYRKAR